MMSEAKMNDRRRPTTVPLAFLLAACAGMPTDAVAQQRATEPSPLAGTWTLVAADLLHPDGSRTRDYGAAPRGRLIVDAVGRYSLQIFKSERPRFASEDKTKGTPAEFAASTLGSSTHFGSLEVDPAAHVLTVTIDGASFPNQEGTQQKRTYVLDGDELSYRVPAHADGNIPISVWHREKRGASLVGTWALTSADNVAPDGSRVHLFGDNPQGILTSTGAGTTPCRSCAPTGRSLPPTTATRGRPRRIRRL